MKFWSKKAIFGAIWVFFEGFGPCLGISHPTHLHLGKISPKKTFFFIPSLNHFAMQGVVERVGEPSKILPRVIGGRDRYDKTHFSSSSIFWPWLNQPPVAKETVGGLSGDGSRSFLGTLTEAQ